MTPRITNNGKHFKRGEIAARIAEEKFAKRPPDGYNHLLGYCVGGAYQSQTKYDFDFTIAPKR